MGSLRVVDRFNFDINVNGKINANGKPGVNDRPDEPSLMYIRIYAGTRAVNPPGHRPRWEVFD
jgi:hypothetical protein